MSYPSDHRHHQQQQQNQPQQPHDSNHQQRYGRRGREMDDEGVRVEVRRSGRWLNDDRGSRGHRHRRNNRDSSSSLSSSSPPSGESDELDRRSRRRTSRKHSRSSRSISRCRRRNRSRSSGANRIGSPGKTDSNAGLPSSTIMLRGLPISLNEQELRDELLTLGFSITELRLVRRRDNGISRGFGFMEFSSVDEAQKFMQSTKGYLLLMNEYPITLIYSSSRWSSHSGEDRRFEPGSGPREWDCVKCGIRNFKRRDACFKCSTTKAESDKIRDLDGFEMTSSIPSDTLVVMGLTFEVGDTNQIVECFKNFTHVPIRNSYLVRNITTGLSRCFALLEFESVPGCMSALQSLQSLRSTPTIAGYPIEVNYCRCSFMNAVYDLSDPNGNNSSGGRSHHNTTTATATTTTYHPTTAPGTTAFAGGTHRQQLPEAQSDRANVAASVAHQALQNLHQTRRKDAEFGNTPAAAGATSAATTVSATYQYDPSTGYYYDSASGLYFDPKTQLFYNPQTNQYMYWNAQINQYVFCAAPSSTATSAVATTPGGNTSQATTAITQPPAEPPTPILADKEKKAEIGKKIALDMARWAESVNRKKNVIARKSAFSSDSSKWNASSAQTQSAGGTSATAVAKAAAAHAASFAVAPSRPPRRTAPTEQKTKPAISASTADEPQLAAVGPPPQPPPQPPPPPTPTQTPATADQPNSLVDWSKLVCLLCKRQFDSKTVLQKHIDRSKLHKDNLEKLTSEPPTDHRHECDDRTIV